VRLSGLGRQQGPSPDGITPAILKQLASVVKVPLTVVFNLSLCAGVFPAISKKSFVFPLFKSGDKRDVFCYCGISILSATPKLFKKMVCDRITPVVGPVISDAQHGFVKGRSTVSNLVQFTNGVIGEIEDGRLTGFPRLSTEWSVHCSRSVEVQFVNFIWLVAFVLDGVASDRSSNRLDKKLGRSNVMKKRWQLKRN
jgi:hypothetical protein